jgi:hypothetical protein
MIWGQVVIGGENRALFVSFHPENGAVMLHSVHGTRTVNQLK